MFSGPNELESVLASTDPVGQPWLLCFEQSVAFCNPVNVVQDVYPNRSGTNTAYSSDTLRRRFANGERVRVEAYDGYVPGGCHEEVELVFTELPSQIALRSK